MKLRILVPICLLVSIFSFAQALRADVDAELKRKVFDACPEVLSRAQLLNSADRHVLVEYLVKILKLPVAAAPQSYFPEQNILGPLDDLRALEAWRSLNPERDLTAKSCALEVLKGIPNQSLIALPELVLIARDHHLPESLIDALGETAFLIANHVAADPKLQIPDSVLAGLTEFLGGEAAILAENLIFELQRASVPYLIRRLRDSDPKKCDAVCRALLSMDPSGSIVGEQLLELIRPGNPDLVIKLALTLGRLPDVYPHSLPVLFSLLKEQKGLAHAALLNALNEALEHKEALSKISLSPEAYADLLIGLRLAKQNERGVIESLASILGKRCKKHEQLLLAQFKEADLDLQQRLPRVLAETGYGVASFVELSTRLTSSDLVVRLNSIVVLGGVRERAAQVMSAYRRVLKANTQEHDPKFKAATYLALLEGLLRSGQSASALRPQPYMTEILALEDELPAEVWLPKLGAPAPELQHSSRVERVLVRALASMQREALPALLKASEGKSALVRRRAALTMALIRPVAQVQVNGLVRLLSDSDNSVRNQAVLTLSGFGAGVARDVRRALQVKSLNGRVAAARVLVSLGIIDSSFWQILQDGFLRGDCNARISIMPFLKRLNLPISAEFNSKLVECLSQRGQNTDSILEELELNRPLALDVQQQLLKVAGAAESNPEVTVKVITRAAQLGLQSDEYFNFLAGIISGASPALQLVALKSVAELGAAAHGFSPKLAQLIDASVELDVKYEAIVAISRVDPSAYPVANYLSDEFSSAHLDEAQSLAVELGPEVALPVLLNVLNRSGGGSLLAAIQTIGDLGPRAFKAVPELTRRLDSKLSRERYVSLVALLKINPLADAVEAALRRELIGTLSQELVLEELPESIRPVLEEIVTHPQSLLEKRNAQVMLGRLGW